MLNQRFRHDKSTFRKILHSPGTRETVTMPELQMDAAVANRFISSLSKSLQALCHGCMEFDSGIEIVGYINVNIDSGSKVDYVLNEKVLKSTTNSMTFVSNSFLARKEHPKQLRDGACSPIPEMHQQHPAFQNRARGFLHGVHSRGATQASHSFMFRGSQKRSWTAVDRDWRMSSKKPRDGRLGYPSPHEPTSTALSNSPSSASSHSLTDTNFKWPQSTATSQDNSDHSAVNIKKEFIENDSEKSSAETEQDHEHDTSANTIQASEVANIKSDPDASAPAVNEESDTSENVDESGSDFKTTFLEMSASEETKGTSEHIRNRADSNDDSDAVALAEQSGEASYETNDKPEDMAQGSESHYDETTEEGTFPHSVYSDAGEGSSDAGQFEVIEIEDEDEDVQAMFGKSQQLLGHQVWSTEPITASTQSSRKGKRKCKNSTTSESYSATNFPPELSWHSSREGNVREISGECFKCAHCSAEFSNNYDLKTHTSSQHGYQMPFVCDLCGKGYQTAMGLTYHKRAHEGRSYPCPVCDSKLSQRSSMRSHLKNIHSVAQCATCCGIFKLGQEYNQHVLHCALC